MNIADKMFEEAGYVKQEFPLDYMEVYAKKVGKIFNYEYKTICFCKKIKKVQIINQMCDLFSPKEIEAIYLKSKEMED